MISTVVLIIAFLAVITVDSLRHSNAITSSRIATNSLTKLQAFEGRSWSGGGGGAQRSSGGSSWGGS